MNAKAPRVDQLLAGLADGDATSHSAFAIRNALRSLGYASDLFAPASHVSPLLQEACRDVESYKASAEDIVLHHYGIDSFVTDRFLASAGRKILIYHNITPAAYFRGFDDDMVCRLDNSKRRLSDLSQACDACWTPSAFNASELKQWTSRNVVVFPLPFDPAALQRTPDSAVIRRLAPSLATILFVGRIAPNKRIEELLESFAWYNRTINPFSRLLIVGSERSVPKYMTYLRLRADEVCTPNICFEGFASAAGLTAYYQKADLFVCTSDHEGYCLPLLEAMAMDVPVLCKKTGGTPEAMGRAGVLYEHLTPRQLAEWMHVMLTDQTLRSKIRDGQRRRIQAERERDLCAELARLLATI